MKKISFITLALLFILMNSMEAQAGELHDAAKADDLAKVKQLLEQGADVNARDIYQRTPLHSAACFGNTAVTALLIEKGADVHARDKSQRTPLHYAADCGNTAVAALLIEKGADVNARDNYQKTPLHLAARDGKTDIAKLFIEKGADVHARDNDNKDTPAMAAEKKGHTKLAAMIQGVVGGSAREDFDALVRNKSGDVKTIVRLARTLTPPPAVPQEARDEMVKGMAAFKLAKRSEDFAAAEAHFSKASHLAPWLPEPYFNLTVAQEKQYKWAAAQNSLYNYLITVTDPKDIQAGKQKMAELDVQRERWEKCKQELDLAEALRVKGPGAFDAAISHYKKAIELLPDDNMIDKAYYGIGEIYMNQGDLDAAYKYMQKAFELVPEPSFLNTARYTNMGVVLERRGDRAKACIYYKKGCDNGSKVSCQNYRNGNCP